MNTHEETLWAIAFPKGGRSTGSYYLYTGTWQTRKDAIAAHIRAKGHDWRWCVRNGDRAVKVTMTFLDPK